VRPERAESTDAEEAGHERRLPPHVRRILIGVLVLVVLGAGATLFGWNIESWFRHIWDTITSLPIGSLIGAIALVTLQTTLVAYSWHSILRYGYPRANVRFIQVLACYAAAVALNWVLPANLGTLAMLLMFTTIILAATFAGVLAGLVVEKIFFTIIGAACYLYLFLTVGGSFDLQLGFIGEHPAAVVILLAAILVLLFLIAQILRERIKHWWEQAKVGGRILTHPRTFLGRVVLPQAISWAAGLGIIAVFLGAYNIPISFHTIMRIVGSNSIANATAVTPGGAGVTQAFNVVSLRGVTSAANATAYSVAQQLVVTVWSIVLAIVLLVRAFGWSEGKTLVRQSYSEARVKSAEQSQARKAKRRAKREAKHHRGDSPSPSAPVTASPSMPAVAPAPDSTSTPAGAPTSAPEQEAGTQLS
jgi:uncharacterized membrane protein YbhN (UPF0104 family)